MEVIYTGLRQTGDQVVSAALQEDVDVLGLSFLCGDHMVLLPKVMAGLKEKGLEHIIVIVGGVILKRQIPAIMKMDVHKVFSPGTPLEEIVRYIEENVSH